MTINSTRCYKNQHAYDGFHIIGLPIIVQSVHGESYGNLFIMHKYNCTKIV